MYSLFSLHLEASRPKLQKQVVEERLAVDQAHLQQHSFPSVQKLSFKRWLTMELNSLWVLLPVLTKHTGVTETTFSINLSPELIYMLVNFVKCISERELFPQLKLLLTQSVSDNQQTLLSNAQLKKLSLALLMAEMSLQMWIWFSLGEYHSS